MVWFHLFSCTLNCFSLIFLVMTLKILFLFKIWNLLYSRVLLFHFFPYNFPYNKIYKEIDWYFLNFSYRYGTLGCQSIVTKSKSKIKRFVSHKEVSWSRNREIRVSCLLLCSFETFIKSCYIFRSHCSNNFSLIESQCSFYLYFSGG